MGCGCAGKARTVTYQYQAPDGSVRNFASQLEARAAQIRAGGGGTITEVAK